jgi:hypothetical protein
MLSFIVSLSLLAGCASDSPAGPTTDFISIRSIVPADGTVLTAGAPVTFTATLECTIVSADGGFTALVVQDQRNQSLRPGDTLAPEAALRRGTTTVTLSQTITAPASGSTVNLLFPIFVNGSNETRAVAVRNYLVR